MKYVKILGLAAVAAMALMAFAGSASATVLTHNGSAMSAPELLDFSVSSTATLNTTSGGNIASCPEGTTQGPITNGGGSGATVKGEIKKLTWVNCNTTVDTLAAGTLELHWITGTENGTVTSSGAKVTINVAGISCTYGTNNTDIGTLVEGSPAKFVINAVINKTEGSFLCPASGNWSGEYTNTEPGGTLAVDA